MLECRAIPIRQNDQGLLAEYDRVFCDPYFKVAEINAAIIERATWLRVQYAFKTPDAIHLATAIEHGASLVLTGDEHFRRCKEINLEIPPRNP